MNKEALERIRLMQCETKPYMKKEKSHEVKVGHYHPKEKRHEGEKMCLAIDA